MGKLWILFLAILLNSFLFNSCQRQGRDPGLLLVRLTDDPDGLNPITTRSSIAVPLMSRIFVGLYDYDPFNLELIPVLADNAYEIIQEDSLLADSGMKTQIKIREEAVWDDGSPVSSQDYLFTILANLICESYGSAAPVMTGLLEGLSFEVPDDKTLVLRFNQRQINVLEELLTIPLLQRRGYDPEQLLSDQHLMLVNDAVSFQKKYKTDRKLEQFADLFNSAVFNREKVFGCGPYRLAAWEAGVFIRLERKEDYWADTLSNRPPQLEALPRQIIYKIIPDDAAAIQAIQSKKLDIAADINPDLFFKLKHDQKQHAYFTFYTPPSLQYYYICLNQQNRALAEHAVRKALAYVLDVNAIVNSFFYGSATVINSPIHPLKKYYDTTIKPHPYSPEKALQVLSGSGWFDYDQDGILEKVISPGDTISLRFVLMTGQRQLGQDIASVFKNEALKVGIQIDIDIVDNTQLIGRLRDGDFDMCNLSGRFSAGYDDLYYMWHRDSRGGKGNNFMYYGDEESDSLIMAIRYELDPDRKTALYKEFQQKITIDQPVLFLCAPDERILSHPGFQILTTPLKPGYMENLVIEK